MISASEGFREAIRAAGLNPPSEIKADGEIHRFAANGKKSDDAGWYVFHGEPVPAGAFGCWRSGVSGTWRGETGRKLTPGERAAQQARIDAARRAAEAERARRQTAAITRANETFRVAPVAPENHPYLTRKGIKAHGVRLVQDALVIPMRNVEGGLYSLQFIGPDGSKRYLSGGRVKGCYFGIGKPDGVLCITEGFATGASVHQATGYAVAVAFDCGNLLPVAQALRAKYPEIRIVLCADDDYRTAGNPGLTAAREAAVAIRGLVAIPDFGDHRPEGATDFNDLMVHRGLSAITECIECADSFEAASGVNSSNSFNSYAPQPDQAPLVVKVVAPEPLNEAAFHGLAGEIVKTIEPHSEADPAALLVQVLVAFGALVGRGPHVKVEGDQHHSNLFLLLCGDTAKARKGTSWGRVSEIFSRINGWPHTVSGLSSGEGLKFSVRDRITRMEKDKKTGFMEEVEVDPGVQDKRLLVLESEFAQVLRQVARPGNTLSPTVRSMWDTGTAQTLTKNDPITATGAHVSIVGHITIDELRRELTQTDSANGFANRFLFTCAKRSKVLPFGGGDVPAGDLLQRIERAAEQARSLGAIGMTDAAKAAWVKVYPTLSEGWPGLFGSVTARSEAQCIRLALVYALIDECQVIDLPHLRAALAVWERCEASARFIFGDALGDPVADEIHRALKVSAGLTRTEISGLFKRNQPAERIGVALELLLRRNLAVRDVQHGDHGGRPTEVWRAA